MEILLGLFCALVVTKAPALKTCGWLLSIIGGTSAMLVYFVTLGLLETVTQVEKHEIKNFILCKAAYLFFGLLTGGVFTYLGWKGFGTAGTILILVGLVIYNYGPSPSLFGGMVFMSASVIALSFVGVSNGPIVMIGLISSGLSAVKAPLSPWTCSLNNFNSWSFLVGALSGVIPGLNADMLHKNTYSGYLSTIMSEGVSLGILISQRSTSKTTLTTFLVQYGGTIEPITAVLLCLASCVLVLSVPGLLDYAQTPTFELDSVSSRILTILTTAYFLNIPGAPLISFILAGFLFEIFQMAKPLLKKMPQGYSKTLAMSPIIFS